MCSVLAGKTRDLRQGGGPGQQREGMRALHRPHAHAQSTNLFLIKLHVVQIIIYIQY